MFLRQSTSQIVRFGPCVDKDAPATEEIALTLAQADMRLSKDGGAFAQKNATGNATHDSDGWYSTTLNATDTATVGILILNVHQPANMLPVWQTFYVVEEAVYDAMYAASASGPNTTTPPTAAAIVNEWESQSQADPTGFHVNLLEMAGSAASVTNLAASTLGIILGTAITGTLTTTSFTTSLTTGYATDELVGRSIIFYDDAGNAGCSGLITSQSSGGLIGVSAGVQTAPANTDKFIIV